MLVSINSIAAQQTASTGNTGKEVFHFSNYAATHPHVILQYTASGMILHIHSDVLFMFMTGAKSQAGRHF
eukprot:5067225-Ditylum_brightwellii.AAC.1